MYPYTMPEKSLLRVATRIPKLEWNGGAPEYDGFIRSKHLQALADQIHRTKHRVVEDDLTMTIVDEVYVLTPDELFELIQMEAMKYDRFRYVPSIGPEQGK